MIMIVDLISSMIVITYLNGDGM